MVCVGVDIPRRLGEFGNNRSLSVELYRIQYWLSSLAYWSVWVANNHGHHVALSHASRKRWHTQKLLADFTQISVRDVAEVLKSFSSCSYRGLLCTGLCVVLLTVFYI